MDERLFHKFWNVTIVQTLASCCEPLGHWDRDRALCCGRCCQILHEFVYILVRQEYTTREVPRQNMDWHTHHHTSYVVRIVYSVGTAISPTCGPGRLASASTALPIASAIVRPISLASPDAKRTDVRLKWPHPIGRVSTRARRQMSSSRV